MIDRLMQTLDKGTQAQYIYCQSIQRDETIQMGEYLRAHVCSFGWECRKDHEEPWEEDGSWHLEVIVYQ